MINHARVYNDGSIIIDDVENEQAWIEYNLLHRPNVALFVKGVCIIKNQLSDNRLSYISSQLVKRSKEDFIFKE